MDIIHYVQSNWFQLIVDGTAALNIIAAGSRVMGWTRISEECGKIENAITAMVQAAINKKGDQNVKETVAVNNDAVGTSSNK